MRELLMKVAKPLFLVKNEVGGCNICLVPGLVFRSNTKISIEINGLEVVDIVPFEESFAVGSFGVRHFMLCKEPQAAVDGGDRWRWE
ncbi:hypothetical protein L1987_60278 [Smallanthus sonchifolius]|uniref:Uncharacterized protein n=1 Tax=Smallanthus sonchifolius TaxID=185202 RepID=A0ACB9D7V3_9ASTR|nr:hypothetical protein L1987_60278 [Smallanthus sonchifolius]